MRWRSLVNHVALPVAILSFYFVVPTGDGSSPVDSPFGFAIAAVCGLVIIWVVVDEARRGDRTLRPMHLLIAFELVWVGFSLTYFLVATRNPAEFVELHTRLDALYFSLTTMATVGYGDVSAQGQLARALVTVQLAFNLAFVGGVVAVFQDMVRSTAPSRRLRRQLRRERRALDSPPRDGTVPAPPARRSKEA